MEVKFANLRSASGYPTPAPDVASQLPVQPWSGPPTGLLGKFSRFSQKIPAPVKTALVRGGTIISKLADIPLTVPRAVQSARIGLEASSKATAAKKAAGQGFISPSGKRMLPEEFLHPGLRPAFVIPFLKDLVGIGRGIGDYGKVPKLSQLQTAEGLTQFSDKPIESLSRIAGFGISPKLIGDIGFEFAQPVPTRTLGMTGKLAGKIPLVGKGIGAIEKTGKSLVKGVGTGLRKFDLESAKALTQISKRMFKTETPGLISSFPGQRFFQAPGLSKIFRKREDLFNIETKKVARFIEEKSKTLIPAEGSFKEKMAVLNRDSKIIGQFMENKNIIPDILSSTQTAYRIGGKLIPIERIKHLAEIANESLFMREGVVNQMVSHGVLTKEAANKFLSTGYLHRINKEHVADNLRKLSIPLTDFPALKKIFSRKPGNLGYIKEFQAPFFIGMAEDLKRIAQAGALREIAEKYGIKVQQRGLKAEDISNLVLREFKKIPKIKPPTVSGLGMGAPEQALARAREVSETLSRSGIFVKPEQLLGKVSKGMGILNEPKNIAWDLLAEVAKKTGKLKLDIPKKTNFILEDILMLVKKNARLNAAAKTGEIKGKIADILERAGAAEGSTQAGFVRVVDALGDGFRKMSKEFGANKETLRRAEALRTEVNKRILSLSGGLTGKQGYFYNREIIENALQNPETGDAMKALLKLRDEINDFAGETRGIGTTPEKLGLVAPPAGTIPQEVLPSGYKVTPKGQLRKEVPGYVPTPDIFKKVGKSAQAITTFGEPKTGVALERVGKLPVVKRASLYIPTVRERNLLPLGYKSAYEALKGRVEDPEVARRILENAALPTEMWDAMLAGRQAIEKRPYMRALGATYGAFMNVWKPFKTLYRPAYYARNGIWNEIMVSNVTGKVLSIPKSLTNALFARLSGDENAVSRTISKVVNKELLKFAEEADAINLIKRQNVVSSAKDILRKYGPTEGIDNLLKRVKFPTNMGAFQSFQEDVSKLEIFSHFRKLGLDKNRAADIAKETIFSPELIDRESRGFYSFIWPFFSFTRQAIPTTIKYGIKNPNTARMLEQIEIVLNDAAGDIDRRYLPDYYKGYIGLPGTNKDKIHRLITLQYVSPYRLLEKGGEFSPFGSIGVNPLPEIFVNAVLLGSMIDGNKDVVGGIDFFRGGKPVTTSKDREQRKIDMINFLLDKIGPESVLGIPVRGTKSRRELERAIGGLSSPLGVVKTPTQVITEQFLPFKPQPYSPEKSKEIQVGQARKGLRDTRSAMTSLRFDLRDKRISRADFDKRMSNLENQMEEYRNEIRRLSQ